MLELDRVNLAYQNQQVIFDFDLQLAKGQFGCLLGPSGCGKSSILRAIAGFEALQSGQVKLGGNIVGSQHSLTPPEKRNIGMVFQDFALFPHLTVAQNIAFGLQHLPARDRCVRVAKMAELIGLTELTDRYPHALSGGQQQRVALARALATEPDLLLLDEPFSSLDEELRETLAQDCANVVRQQGITTLMVTHDQHEAFALADVIAVMNEGRLQQVGTAYELYHQPSNAFVADFVGDGVFIDARTTVDGQLETCLGKFSVKQLSSKANTQLKLLVRPDDILHVDESERKAKVVARAFQGAHIFYQLELIDGSKQRVQCLAPSHHDHQIGEVFGIQLDIKHLVYFEM